MPVVAVVAHQLQHRTVAIDLAYQSLEAIRILLIQELIRVPVAHHRALHAIERARVLLPGVHVLAVFLPEIRRQLEHPRVEQIRVFDGLVAVIVFGLHTDDGGLDAQVDVLRDQRDARLRVLALQRQRLTENCVIRSVARQGIGQSAAQNARLEEQSSGRALLVSVHLRSRQRQAFVDLHLAGVFHELIEESTDLPHVASSFGQTFLTGVQLLEHDHGNEDVVLIETKDGGGIVHEHVGVENENAMLA